MSDLIIPALVGAICIALGISNIKGNLSSLHFYHRKRVSEEDRLPFGKTAGFGTVIVGIAVIIYSGLSAAAVQTDMQLFSVLGAGILIVGIAVGLGLNIYAMLKYNKGIF